MSTKHRFPFSGGAPQDFRGDVRHLRALAWALLALVCHRHAAVLRGKGWTVVAAGGAAAVRSARIAALRPGRVIDGMGCSAEIPVCGFAREVLAGYAPIVGELGRGGNRCCAPAHCVVAQLFLPFEEDAFPGAQESKCLSRHERERYV